MTLVLLSWYSNILHHRAHSACSVLYFCIIKHKEYMRRNFAVESSTITNCCSSRRHDEDVDARPFSRDRSASSPYLINLPLIASYCTHHAAHALWLYGTDASPLYILNGPLNNSHLYNILTQYIYYCLSSVVIAPRRLHSPTGIPESVAAKQIRAQ